MINYQKYSTTESLYTELRQVSSIWNITSQLGQWSTLAGFLILPSLYDTSSQLRLSSDVLMIVAIVLSVGGYSLSFISWYANRSIIFHQNHIFIPGASVSLFALLANGYCFAVSGRYSIHSSAAITALSLSTVSTIIHCLLASVLARTINSIAARSSAADGHSQKNSSPTNPIRCPSNSSNTASLRTPSPIGAFLLAKSRGISASRNERRVKKQMANLLKRKETAPETGETFKLEWPVSVDEHEEDTSQHRNIVSPLSKQSSQLSVRSPTRAPGKILKKTVLGHLVRREERLVGPEIIDEKTEQARMREIKRRNIEMEHLNFR